jgi:hydroxymethylpyrimidine pyrophosphatase-like HAD family hydrolase
VTLVVTDLDGTLWGRDAVAGPATRAAVAELLADGHRVLAATARRPRAARALLDANAFALPVVGLNGAMGVQPDGTTRFHAVPFTAVEAERALGAFSAHDLRPCVYVLERDVDVVLPPGASTHPDHQASLAGVIRAGDPAATIAAQPVFAFSVLGRPEGLLRPVADALEAAGFGFDLAPEPVWPDWGLTVMAPGVSKWAGVRSYCAAAGLSPHDVLAVGDGSNDVPLLREAAWPLTIATSRAAALLPDTPTIPPPALDGWAEIPALLRRRAAA